MTPLVSTAELEAYLDESLPAERMSAVEEALRRDAALAATRAKVIGRRDAGLHSLGAIWRRHRLSCPSREELGGHLLGILDAGTADYVRFHLETIGCRYCLANVEDLKSQQDASESNRAQGRRKRYFQSSAGYLSGE
jgi:hypothetical protein